MQFDDIVTNDFGVLTYIIAQSVLPDIVLMCNYVNTYDIHIDNGLSIELQNRYGFSIDYDLITNKYIDPSTLQEGWKNNICTIDNSFVDVFIEKINTKTNETFYNIFNNTDVEKIISSIVSRLS